MIEQEATNTRAGAMWAWVPALLLGTMLVGLGSIAYLAIDDPHFALESDYYDKAVHWDRSQQQARESQALGLQLGLTAPLALSNDARVKLQLSIRDRDNLAFTGATVALEAFPNAYAKEVQHLVLREVTPGVYEGELAAAVRGLWELRVVVKQGALVYTQILRTEVVKGDAA